MSHLVAVACLLLLSLGLSSADVTVSVDWTNVTFISKTRATLQLVINPLILRQSPIHDAVYENLRRLHTTHARYASWFPYPTLSVPSLDPPSGLSQCRDVAAGFNATLSCELGGGVIDTVEFASFGLPGGVCRSFVANDSCTAPSSMDVINKLCVGQASCSVPASADVFGSPCPGHEADYRLAVQVTCNPPQNNTYWDFTHFDRPVIDFLEATRGQHTASHPPPLSRNRTTISACALPLTAHYDVARVLIGGEPMLELCTTPDWLWDQKGQPVHHYPNDPIGEDWGYNTGNQLVDPTCEQIGQWFGRLAAWYTMGGLYDEYGNFHRSPHHYNLTMWEVLNEMEHGLDIQTYTCIYDQVVKYVRQYADPDHHIHFVGLAELDASVYGDYAYFLNTSNHLPDTPLDWISYHRYASSNSRTDPAGYESFFDQYDGFFDIVRQVELIRTSLSPSTRTHIDEIGVILPDDNDPAAVQFPTVYWNAVAASFAYLFGHLSAVGIDMVGSSQLVGYPQLYNVTNLGDLPPQYPSVSMVNWTTGAGTARVWLLDLLIRNFEEGDKLVATASTNSTDVFAQGYVRSSDSGSDVQKVLLVNKRMTARSVTVTGAAGGEMETVDEASGEKPARREKLSSDNVVLAPFAVSVVRLSNSNSGRVAME